MHREGIAGERLVNPVALPRVPDDSFDLLFSVAAPVRCSGNVSVSDRIDILVDGSGDGHSVALFPHEEVFFSYERFPAPAIPLIRALPLTALNDALRGVMLDGASLVGVEFGGESFGDHVADLGSGESGCPSIARFADGKRRRAVRSRFVRL